MLPSFLFAGMDPQTKRLAAELESLGGGDAKAAHLELHTIIDDTLISAEPFAQPNQTDIPNKRSKLSQILWPLGKSVGLRDIKLPGTTAIADSMQYFPVSSAIRVSSIDQQRHSPFHPQSCAIATWLKNGFNATVVNYGPKYDLKTNSIFGPQVPLASLQHPSFAPKLSSPTMVSEILGLLYKSNIDENHIPSAPLPAPCTIAVSMWYLQKNHVVDVCTSSTSSATTMSASSATGTHNATIDKEWLQFVSIECPDYETAIKVIQTGRSRCPQTEEHHVFLRILIYRPHKNFSSSPFAMTDTGALSHLHLVDLVNASGVDTAEHKHLPTEESRIARRDHWLQLNSLWHVMQEMADLSRKSDKNAARSDKTGVSAPAASGGGDRVVLTSARSSKLTVLLAPLLQGNTKTWFFVHLLDGEDHFQQSSHTLKHVEGITDIVTGCYRVQDVNVAELELRQANTVLMPVFDRGQVAATQPQHDIDPERDTALALSHTTTTTAATKNPSSTKSLSKKEEAHSFFTALLDKETLPTRSHGVAAIVEEEEEKEEEVNLHSLAAEKGSYAPHLPSAPHPTHKEAPSSINEAQQHLQEQEKQQKSEYKELMSEFNALMEEVSSSTPVAHPLPLVDPIELAHQKGLQPQQLPKQHASEQNVISHQNQHLPQQNPQSSGDYIPYAQNQTSGNDVPFRHHAHSTVSSETPSYSMSHDDQEDSDSQYHASDYGYSNPDNQPERQDDQDDVLWDSLDEDEDCSRGSNRDSSRNRSGSGHTNRRNKRLDSRHSSLSGASAVFSSASTAPHNYHQHQQSNSRHQKHHSQYIQHSNSEPDFGSNSSDSSRLNTGSSPGRRNSPGKSVPVTSSFYNWAANTPKSLTNVKQSIRSDSSQSFFHRRDGNSGEWDGNSSDNDQNPHFHSHRQQQQQPSSPQRLIDSTHQELLESIERQRLEQEAAVEQHRECRFPYYETVAAIESSSPHQHHHRDPNHHHVGNKSEANTQVSGVNDEKNMAMHEAGEGVEFSQTQGMKDSTERRVREDHDENDVDDYKSENEKLRDELTRLEHVNNSLLLALQQEQYDKSVVETKLQLMQDTVLEARTQKDLEIDNHKMEVLRLKGHVRRLSQKSGFEETLRGFEEELSRAQAEKKQLKKRYAILEEKLFLLGNGAGDDEAEMEGCSNDKENGHTASVPSLPLYSNSQSHSRSGSSSTSSSSGNNAHNISTSTSATTQSLSVVWTPGGMTTAGGSENAMVSAKEFRILKHKYKRAEKAKDDITCAYEELKKKERKYVLGAKHAEENTKRFKNLSAETELLAQQLQEAMTSLDIKTQEVELLKHEALALQEAERNIRSERSNIVNELSVARQRLRENEAELKDQRYRNRFISKHGYLGGGEGGSNGGRVGPSQHHHQHHQQLQQQALSHQQQQEQIIKNNQAYFDLLANSNSAFEHLIPLPNNAVESKPEAVSGLAGTSDAMYVRAEEVETFSIELEQALLNLRDAITLNLPSLLPMVHILSDELRKERALAHQQKVALVMKLSGHRQGVGSNNSTGKKRLSVTNFSTPGKYDAFEGGKSNMSVSFASNHGSVSASLPSKYANNSHSSQCTPGGSSGGGLNKESNHRSARKLQQPHRFSHLQSHRDIASKDHESIIFAESATEGGSLTGVSGASTSGKGGNKPKMVFFRRVE